MLELEKFKESLQGDQSALPGQEETRQLADIQTPPLPNMAMPMVQTARANVNPNTNLTRSQEALLSPEEKIIASRRV